MGGRNKSESVGGTSRNMQIAGKNIREHYSVSNNGSKFGVTHEGEIRWFVLNAAVDIERYIDIAIDYNSSHSIIDALKSGKSQLALLTEAQKKEPVSNWKNYIVPIDGKLHYNEHNINYSFLDKFNVNGIDNNQIQKIYRENVKGVIE